MLSYLFGSFYLSDYISFSFSNFSFSNLSLSFYITNNFTLSLSFNFYLYLSLFFISIIQACHILSNHFFSLICLFYFSRVKTNAAQPAKSCPGLTLVKSLKNRFSLRGIFITQIETESGEKTIKKKPLTQDNYFANIHRKSFNYFTTITRFLKNIAKIIFFP